jgi:SMC interacting uncharacterized protein involved in chromosome segregation
VNNIPHIINTGASVKQIDKDFEEWKPLLKMIMEFKQKKEEVEILREQIRHLEQQIYGGSTK